MRGNGWVGGLIRYIRRKDGHNAANMQQKCAKDEDQTVGFRNCFFLEWRAAERKETTQAE